MDKNRIKNMVSKFQVGPDEMAVRVHLGKPIDTISHGMCYDLNLLLPGSELIKISTNQYKADIEPVEAYTKDLIPVIVDSTLYLFFPKPGERDENGKERLIRVMQAGIPTTNEGIAKHFESAIHGVLRAVVGKFTWEEVINNLEKIKKEADSFFKPEKGKEEKKELSLIEAGFNRDDFTFTVERVELLPSLKKATLIKETARLEAEAEKFVARKESTGTMGFVVQNISEATGESKEEINERIKSNPERTVYYEGKALELAERRIAIKGGSFNHIHVDGVGDIEKNLIALARILQGSQNGQKGKDVEKTKKVIMGGQEVEVEDEE
ncbi:MAG: SPFH domain-containing protein [Candidatus Nealsonbacteria bacterium]